MVLGEMVRYYIDYVFGRVGVFGVGGIVVGEIVFDSSSVVVNVIKVDCFFVVL